MTKLSHRLARVVSIVLIITSFQLVIQQAVAASRFAVSSLHACSLSAGMEEPTLSGISQVGATAGKYCCDHCAASGMPCDGTCTLLVTVTLSQAIIAKSPVTRNSRPSHIAILLLEYIPAPDFIPPRQFSV